MSNSVFRRGCQILDDLPAGLSSTEVMHALSRAGVIAPDAPTPKTPETDPWWAGEYEMDWEWVPFIEWMGERTGFFFNWGPLGAIPDTVYGSAGFGAAEEVWEDMKPGALREIAGILIAAADWKDRKDKDDAEH